MFCRLCDTKPLQITEHYYYCPTCGLTQTEQIPDITPYDEAFIETQLTNIKNFNIFPNDSLFEYGYTNTAFIDYVSMKGYIVDGCHIYDNTPNKQHYDIVLSLNSIGLLGDNILHLLDFFRNNAYYLYITTDIWEQSPITSKCSNILTPKTLQFIESTYESILIANIKQTTYNVIIFKHRSCWGGTKHG